MHRRRALRALLLVFAASLAGTARAEEDPRPWEEQPFLGLSVRDTEHGLVVSWIAPGPLGGRGFESHSGLRRGDNVVSVDGEAFDADGLKRHLRALEPGARVRIAYRRSEGASMDSAVPRGGAGGEEHVIEATLGVRAAWSGTIRRGLRGRTIPETLGGTLEDLVLAASAEVGVREGVPGGGLDALLAYLGRVQEENLDPNALACVVRCFRRPLAAEDVAVDLATRAHAAARGDVPALAAFVRHVLDLPVAEAFPEAGARGGRVREALAQVAARHAERAWRADVERLLATMRESVYLYDDRADDHVHFLAALADPAGGGVEALLAPLLVLWADAPALWEALATAHAQDAVLAEIPEALRGAVEGDVLWVGEDPAGRPAVLGGKGPNRYDMRHLGAVYDLGGDDRYEYGRAEEGGAFPFALRIVIDLAGDDVHESTTAFEGPATAVGGFSLLEDRAGNDVYRTSAAFGVAAGALGFGVLVDHQGHDVYEATGPASGWGIGAGFYGAGLVVDRAGSDVYRGERLVQGVGGPRGLGAVLDLAGEDRYVANGPHFGSVYGTPGVAVGMSQGFGVGVRGYAAGGLGLLHDAGGHDRYEAGEFSQAGGYFWGMGVLHDAAGHDLHYGNRYGQGFSAHQAVGVFLDDSGDDTYWSMTAASQGGAWDQSIALLVDRAGNDAYRCDGLGQGAASMQALALLVDLGGDDRYTGAGAVQGQGGGNTYHHAEDGVFSFSGLFDLGGGRDAYSSERENGTTKATGTLDEKDPSASTLHGVFVDR
jgi:hypothetical protein